jgi:hypothetical protein
MIAIGVLVVAVVAVLLGYGDDDKGKGGDRDAAASGGASPSSSPSASAGATPARTPIPIGSGAVEGTVRDLRRVDVYEEPRLGADKVMSLTGGTRVIATCHRPGPVGYYGGRRSEVWIHIVSDNRVGYVPSVYVDTGGDITGQVTACSG